jgi:hypothetical protein
LRAEAEEALFAREIAAVSGNTKIEPANVIDRLVKLASLRAPADKSAVGAPLAAAAKRLRAIAKSKPDDVVAAADKAKGATALLDATGSARNGIAVDLTAAWELAWTAKMNASLAKASSLVFGNPLTKLTAAVVESVAVDPAKKEAKEAVLVTALGAHAASAHASGAVQRLLRSDADPMAWACKEDIYLLGLHYRDAHLVTPGLIEAWCLAACRRERESNAALAMAQKWLRRAERLGVTKSPGYVQERDALDVLLKKTANPVRLPAHAEQQEPTANVVGEDERGHLHYNRIVRWAERLLGLHPEVEAVRLVRKDGGIPLRPTRLLETLNRQHHIDGVEVERIIPAALDASYCIPSNGALRINIILPKGRTVQEREAVVDKLRGDTSLFGEDA